MLGQVENSGLCPIAAPKQFLLPAIEILINNMIYSQRVLLFDITS